ncbi:MAG TPA: phospholipase, partial [Myxococcaceae bacterium]|nr:phospholipase [Myxococcaceae bacterium]
MNAGVTSTVGELEVHVVQPEAGARPPLLVVFCHGYGASGEDLVPFVPELVERDRRLATVRYAFPAGPLSMGAAAWGDARAWWP